MSKKDDRNTMTDKSNPPVDPSTLPDPEDITEDDLGQAPPRPEAKKKRALRRDPPTDPGRPETV